MQAINHLQIRLVSAAPRNWITQHLWPPLTISAVSLQSAFGVSGARSGLTMTGYKPGAALPCIFACLHDAGGRRDGKPAVADWFCECLGGTSSVFERLQANNTHKFSANGAARSYWVTPSPWPHRLHSFGKGGDQSIVFRWMDGRPSLTRYYSVTHGVLVTGRLRPPMAGQSRPTIFFCAWAPHAPIFFSRSSLGSSIVFFRNP